MALEDADVVVQAVKYFEAFYGTKFTLIHCWECIKDCPKWKSLYNSLKRGHNPEAGEDGVGEDVGGPSAKRPKGHK